ncbi:hypothetical protein VTL71DRAFT_11900 [Oculimacula yallundae]|uniref:Uncharacterized protein n=1 Tax=Oculimacula yallundae TaxID=86028 RepID=A0ABR4CSK5_9HELO
MQRVAQVLVVGFDKDEWTLPEAAVVDVRMLESLPGNGQTASRSLVSLGCWDTGPSCNPDPAGASLGGVGWGKVDGVESSSTKTSPGLTVLSAMHLTRRIGDVVAFSHTLVNGTDVLCISTARYDAAASPPAASGCFPKITTGLRDLLARVKRYKVFFENKDKGKQACEMGGPYLTVRGSVSIPFHLGNVACGSARRRQTKRKSKKETRQLGNASELSDTLPTHRFSSPMLVSEVPLEDASQVAHRSMPV